MADGGPPEIPRDVTEKPPVEKQQPEKLPAGKLLQARGGSENDLLTPTQASSDDLTAPYYVSNSQQNVVDSRKSLPIVGGNQALIVGRNLNEVPFGGRSGSTAVEEGITDPTGTPRPRTEGEARLVVGVGPQAESASVWPQYIVEARAQIAGIMKKNCHPTVLSLLVSNDNNAQQQQAETDSTDDSRYKRPPLDAEKSCSIIKTELEDSGIMVIPVTNRPKEYLLAVLMVLAVIIEIPKSCELFWFLFTGHGSCGAFCMNGEVMTFEELIHEASKIRIKYAAFFFECCQLHNEDKIKVAEIKKQYVAVYSAPPNRVSYHYNGVGLMMIVLADILREGPQRYTGSFSELQRLVRQRLVEKMTEIRDIPEDIRELFIANYLPVQTSTMYDDFSFYKKISDAMRPVINMKMVPLTHTAIISIHNPNRILCHPSNSKYELVRNVVELKVGEQQERVHLAEVPACFGENIVINITLPPQASQVSGELRAGCEYGDGRVEFCNPCQVDKLPCYDPPVIHMCTVEKSQCEVTVAYDPRIAHPDSEEYKIESIEIGFHDSDSWHSIHHKDGYDFSPNVLVVLPPSREPVQRQLQVAVKYVKCQTPVFSTPYTVDQQPISVPEIATVEHKKESLTATLTIRPNQPSLHTPSDPYTIKGYCVRSRVDDDWKVILEKELQPDETLDEEFSVDVRLTLVKKRKVCQYEVLLEYGGISDVRSVIFDEIVGAIAKPEIQSIEEIPTDSLTAILKFFPHQPRHPSDPSHCQIEKYHIMSRHRGGEWHSIFEKTLQDGVLGEEECAEVRLELAVTEVFRDYKVVLHYCSVGEVESQILQSKTNPIDRPEIESVVNDYVDKVTGRLTFLPHQPVSQRNPDLCRVDRYQVRSRFKHGDWEVVADQELPLGNFFSERQFVGIPIPLCAMKKTRQYQVVLHYRNIGEVYSAKLFEQKTNSFRKPEIEEVSADGDFFATLRFRPNQPSSAKNPDLCRVSCYDINVHSRVHNGWTKVDTITVGSGLLGAEENVTVPLHLLSEGRHFKFKITMHYPKEEKVESPEYSLPDPLDPIRLPYGVAVSYDAWPGFGASIKWKLDYAPPANENVAADLKCVVVIDGQQLGDPVPISSRSVPVDPAVISRSSCITVGVCHSSHKQLGELYSEPSKGTSIFSRFRQRLPKLLKYCVIPLQLLLLLLVAVVVIIQLCCLVSHNTELVVVGQTSSHEPGGYLDQFSTRETVTMTANKDVDNECLKVTVFSIDRSDANPVNCTTTSKKYNNGRNQTIPRGTRQPVPIAYMNDPQRINDGGMIELTARVYVAKGGDLRGRHIAIYYFESRGSAIDFLNGGSDKMAVFSYDLKKWCIKQTCSIPYPVHLKVPDTFFFFVISSDVNADVYANLNFVFQTSCYDNHYTDLNVREIVNVSVNESGSISLHPSRLVLLYPHPLNESDDAPADDTCDRDRQVGHVEFTAKLDPSKPVPLSSLLGVLALNVGCFLFGCFYTVFIFRHRIHARIRGHGGVNERTHLINNP